MARTVTQEGVGIGWKPEAPSHLDHLFADRRQMVTQTALPPHVDLFEFQGPVRNQGGEGSCVGHGVSAAAECLTRQDGDRFKPIYSPRFAYNEARLIEQERDKNDALKFDNGAYVRDGMDGLRRIGVCPESSWRYRPVDDPKHKTDFRQAPSPSRVKAAHRFRVETLACTVLEEVINAIAAGHPVVGGFVCFTNWWTPQVDRTGVCPMPTSNAKPDGGHCTLWCGYDVDFDFGQGIKGGILFKNSWSEAWGSAFGHKGYGIFPMEFVRRGWADDPWAAVKEAA